MGDQTPFMVPATDADVGQLSQIQAMRMLSDQNARMAQGMDKIVDQLGEVARDIAVLKSHDYKHEMDLTRQAFAAAVTASDAKIESSRREWMAVAAAADQRLETLLSASLEDRRQLWIANEARKGEIKNLTDRVLPIVALLTTASAAVVAFIVKQVLG